MRLIIILSLTTALMIGVVPTDTDSGETVKTVSVEPMEVVEETVEVTEPIIEVVDVPDPATEPTIPKYVISINEEEAIALAKMVWGEARGLSDIEIAATVWCVLNRADNWDMSIIEVVTAPNQFHGYHKNHPVNDRIYNLVVDVLTRWQMEKQGASPDEVGRVLPQEYMYFHGDGVANHFRDSWKGGNTWNWECNNPYETE